MTGRRGPPSQPTELRILKGNPSEKPLNHLEPKPKKVTGPKPLRWLCSAAKKIWRAESPKLERLGLLTEIDLNAFARYCDLLARFQKVAEALAKLPNFYYPIYAKQSKAEIKAKAPRIIQYLCPYPEVALYNQLVTQLNRAEREFGLTPASRTAIQVKPMGSAKDTLRNKLFGSRG